MKKWIISLGLLFLTPFCWGAMKNCPVAPSYDIFIDANQVQIVNSQHDLIISPDGEIKLDGKVRTPASAVRNQAGDLQTVIRKQLPAIEVQASSQLNSLRKSFILASNKQLKSSATFNQYIEKLHTNLLTLLHTAIVTEQGRTQFYYQPFNTMKEQADTMGKNMLNDIVNASLNNIALLQESPIIMNLINAKWKEQQDNMNNFDLQVCNLVADIDEQYNTLLKGL